MPHRNRKRIEVRSRDPFLTTTRDNFKLPSLQNQARVGARSILSLVGGGRRGGLGASEAILATLEMREAAQLRVPTAEQRPSPEEVQPYSLERARSVTDYIFPSDLFIGPVETPPSLIGPDDPVQTEEARRVREIAAQSQILRAQPHAPISSVLPPTSVIADGIATDPTLTADFDETLLTEDRDLAGIGGVLEGVAQPFEIFGKTVTEQVGGAVRGDRRPFPITAKAQAEVHERFKDLPLYQQVFVGALEPTLIAGKGKAVVGVTKGVFEFARKNGWRPIVHRGEVQAEKELARQAHKLALERIAKEIDVAQYPSTAAMLELQTARTAVRGPFDLLGRARRLADPSSELKRVDLDDDTRTVLEASFVGLNMDKMRHGFVTDIMARITARGDIKKLFGEDINIDDFAKKGVDARGGRATNVTHLADGTELKGKAKNPFFGNVFENHSLYQLTDEQIEYIEFQHRLFDDILKYAKAEGVDIKELGRLDDAFWYFPRYVEKIGKKKSFDGLKDRSGNPLRKTRLNELMTEDVIKNGSKYRGPTESTRSYFDAVYREIARERTVRELKTLSRTRKVAKNILWNADIATTKLARKDLIIRDVQKIRSGFFPPGPTRAAWKRQFDHLLDEDIDRVLELKQTDMVDLVRSVSQKVQTAIGPPAMVRFTKALLDLQNEAPIVTRTILEQLRDGKVSEKQISRAQELVNKLHTVRGVERAREKASGSLDLPENKELKDFLFSGDKSLAHTKEFSQRRGYTDAQFAELQELKQLTNRVRFVDPQVLEQAFPGIGKTRKRVNYNDLDHDLIKAAMREAGIVGKKAADLETEAIVFGENLLKGERGLMLKTLLQRMNSARKVAKDAKTEMGRIKSQAIADARTPGSSEAFVTGPKGVSESFGLRGEIFTGEIAELIKKKFAPDEGNKFVKFGSDLAGTIRTIDTTIDFGAPLILGLPKLFSDPAGWAKATGMHIQAFKDPIVRARYIAKNHEAFIDFIQHGGGVGSSEWMESLRAGGWFAKLPIAITESGLPSPISSTLSAGPKVFNAVAARFNSSFETFLDVSKLETWKAIRGTAKNERELNELATFTNQLLGSSDPRALGIRTTQRELENAIVFYAPQYFRATAGMMMDVMRGGVRGKNARSKMSALLFGGAVAHYAMATALGQEPQLNPTVTDPVTGKVRLNPNFMKVELFGQNIGLGTKYLSWLRTLIRLAVTAKEKPEAFVTWENWDPSNVEAYRENPALSAVRNQSSSIATTLAGLISGQDTRGRPMSLSDPLKLTGQVLREAPLTFWVSAAAQGDAAERSRSGADFFSTDALPKRLASGVTGAVTEFIGGFATSISTFKELDDLYDKRAREFFGKSWDEIRRSSPTAGREEKKILLREFDDLRIMQGIYQNEQRALKINEKRVLVDNKLDENKRDEIAAIELAVSVFNNPESAENILQIGFVLKTAIREAAIARRSADKQIEDDFPGVFERREEYQADLRENFPFIAAQNNFFDSLGAFTTDDPPGVVNPETGKTDYRALDALKERINEEFGLNTMDEIGRVIHENRLDLRDRAGNALFMPKTYIELVESYETVRPYWESYKKVVPQKEWETWLDFDDASDREDLVTGESDKDRLMRANPKLEEWEEDVDREKILVRRESREIDSLLILFSNRTPVNEENIQEIREFVLEKVAGQGIVRKIDPNFLDENFQVTDRPPGRQIGAGPGIVDDSNPRNLEKRFFGPESLERNLTEAEMLRLRLRERTEGARGL